METPSPERRSAHVGESFTVRVQANPTTGFGWQAMYDSRALTLVDRKFELGSPDIGGGGEEVLTFRSLKPGRVTLTLELRRPWEKAAVARETRLYEISTEA